LYDSQKLNLSKEGEFDKKEKGPKVMKRAEKEKIEPIVGGGKCAGKEKVNKGLK